MKPGFFTFALMTAALLVLSTPSAQSGEKAADPVMCDIVGTISNITAVQRSPWSDGTPSTMSTIETQVHVIVEDRAVHGKAPPPEGSCKKKEGVEKRTYKLCSSTKIKKGDRIIGTEGTQTGSIYVIGCLFDLVVLPPKQ